MMTKKTFEAWFKEEVMPLIFIQENRWQVKWECPDGPLRREEWNNMVDMYIQEGIVPERAGDWVHPRWLETMKPSKHFFRLFGDNQFHGYPVGSHKRDIDWFI